MEIRLLPVYRLFKKEKKEKEICISEIENLHQIQLKNVLHFLKKKMFDTQITIYFFSVILIKFINC